MKTRNGWVITIIAVVSLGWVSTSAWAGSVQQHRWEGVAMGAGAVILGSALVHPIGGPPVAFSFNYRRVYRHPSHYRGNWKRYHGGHRKPWRHYDRGQHYRGPHRQGRAPGISHRKHLNAPGRKASAGQGRHSRGHGGQRR